ncbi:MAG: hypothetical protein ACI399_01105 [Candidatus Cryptobacteroides sp.]
MEYTFKKVHTPKDLLISVAVIAAGSALFVAAGKAGEESFISNKSLWVFVAACGLLMTIFWKNGYRCCGCGVVLKKKAMDLCNDCKKSIIDFLNGEGVNPTIREGHEGGCVRLEVYYNRASSLAYVQLFEYRNYVYEPLTPCVKLPSGKAEQLLAKI